MEKRWRYCKQPSPEAIEALSKQINVNPYLSSILIQRGICTFEDAKNFFRPSLQNLYDPFLMKDMDAAVNRLRQAIEARDRILIYGD